MLCISGESHSTPNFCSAITTAPRFRYRSIRRRASGCPARRWRRSGMRAGELWRSAAARLVAQRLRVEPVRRPVVRGGRFIGRPAGSRIVVVAPIERWCASRTASDRPL